MSEAKLQPLLKLWIHSREDDAAGVTVYRPAGFAFPPSRGRDGIELRPDATVVLTDSGPDDRGRSRMASWKRTGDDSIEVLAEGASNPRRMTIIECSDDILRVRWGAP